MASQKSEEFLSAIVHEILEKCPKENAAQFLADRISEAFRYGYEVGVKNHGSPPSSPRSYASR